MKQRFRAALAATAALAAFPAGAGSFSWAWGEHEIEGVANTSLTAGVGVRMQDRSVHHLSKGSQDPDLCGRAADGGTFYQACQGLFRTQSFPAARLSEGPGQFGSNADDGNWNYAQHDLTQAPLKLTQDLTLNWGNFGLFARVLWFYDFVNNDFTEYHPNRVTAQNVDQVGNVSMIGDELLPTVIPTSGVRSDSRPCPPERNPTGGPCGLVYGPGGVVRNARNDGETLRQIGTDFQWLDLNVYGQLPLWGEQNLTFKIGRQTVNWGESTLLFFDSVNQANPVNANNFFRVGMAVEEIFIPVNMVFLSTQLFEGASLEGFYQLEWVGAEAPAYGSFFSFLDAGTGNAIDFLTLGFGQTAEDPDRVALLLDNPLSGVTNTSAQIKRMADREPKDEGQFGVAFKYYADWLNEGTEISLYFMNYHARFPYLSLQSAPHGCGFNARDTVTFMQDCPDLPLIHALTMPNDPEGATSDATQFDNIFFMLDYPEDIRMWGVSFNTTLGDFSVQGEVAYRPDQPLQVDSEDLAFMAYGPAIGLCHLPETGCSGSNKVNPASLLPLPIDLVLTGLGTLPNGQTGTYPSSDFVIDAQGTPGDFNDSFDLIIGHAVGSGRAFPSFVAPYRGYTLGKNPPQSYIQGWEKFDTWSLNLGGTYLMGATDLVSEAIGADQIIWILESGAMIVPDLPPLDVLQLEAPGTFLHASAGADGSGSDRSRQACSTNLACSYGVDGLRFNPHQENLDLYPDKVSAGYVIVAQVRYESLLPGISLAPLIVWKHDVYGTAPGLAANFVENRKIADVLLEARYKSNTSFNLGYTWYTGAGTANVLKDRDQARFFVKYQF